MRFQVPQFVDIEDKIIGPLTLKQFIFYLIAGLFLVPIWVLFNVGTFVILAVPIVGIAALFAHVHFAGMNFIQLLYNGFMFFLGTRLYIWSRGSKTKEMRVYGVEYDAVILGEGGGATTSLTSKADALNTEGNVSEDDIPDPLLEEEEV